MPEITLKIRNKRAEVVGTPAIVCGNNDYTLTLDLDSEWANLTDKVAHFEFWNKGVLEYTNKQFSGTTCSVPIFYDIDAVDIVIYAGDIHTGAPVRIPCIRTVSRAAANRPDTQVIISESSGDIVLMATGIENDETLIGDAEEET